MPLMTFQSKTPVSKRQKPVASYATPETATWQLQSSQTRRRALWYKLTDVSVQHIVSNWNVLPDRTASHRSNAIPFDGLNKTVKLSGS